uniref:Leucine-rich repeat-containing protein n=1 Tax=Parastrongyloides trichosuri TaxID=131310 RepID=A0A0N4ZLS1_PARTI
MKLFTSLQDILKIYEAATSGTTVPPQPPISSVPNHLPSQIYSNINNNSDSSQGSSMSSRSDVNLPRTTVAVASEADNEVIEKMIKDEENDLIQAGKTTNDEDEPITKCSHNRRVHFPPDDKGVVTGVHNPTASSIMNTKELNCDPASLLQKYIDTCKIYHITPLPFIEKQINSFQPGLFTKQETLYFTEHKINGKHETNPRYMINIEHMEAIECIFMSTKFVVIDLEYSFIDDEAAQLLGELIEYYKPVERLNLSFNKKIGEKGWRSICLALLSSYEISYLNLRHTSVTQNQVFPMFCSSLRDNKSITCLHLENVKLSGRHLFDLATCLSFNHHIKELYLGDNDLNHKDGEALEAIISRNASIELLDLRNNKLGDQGLRRISDALKTSWAILRSQIFGLVLWNNDITGKSMTSLAGALNAYGKLETLNIGCNNIQDSGIFDLKPALQNPSCSIKRLGLQDTNLDNQSVILLAECLTVNKNLMRLDIRNNPKLGLAGFIALHKAMKANSTLTVLNIDKCCSEASSEKVQGLQNTFDECYKELESCCDKNRRSILNKDALSPNEDILSETENEDEDGWVSYNNVPSEGNQNIFCVGENIQQCEFNNNDTLTLAESLKLLMSGEGINLQNKVNELPKDGMLSEMPSSLASIFRPPGLVHAESDCSVVGMRKRHNSSGAVNRVGRSLKKKRNVSKIVRSSSLTCEEHISDIKERVIHMEGSLHDINKSTNISTEDNIVNNSNNSPVEAFNSGLSHNLSSSLPSLNRPSPQKQKVPVKRIRRFSVSPASSFTDLAPCTKDNVIGPQTKSRFVVRSVPNLSTLDEDCEKKCFQNNSAPVTPQRKTAVIVNKCPFETIKEEDQKVISGVINDLVTFCAYDNEKKNQEVKSTTDTKVKEIKDYFNESDLEREEKVQEVVSRLINVVVEQDRAETKKTTARSRLATNSVTSHPIYALVRASTK